MMLDGPVAPLLSPYGCTMCRGEYALAAWIGRCPDCHAINSLRPIEAPIVGGTASAPVPPGLTRRRPMPPRRPRAAEAVVAAADDDLVDLGDCQGDPIPRMATGHAAIDDHLRGGIPTKGVLLFAGHPGAGKSRLTIDLAARLAHQGKRVLVASGEEQRDQLGARSEELRLRERFPDAFVAGRLVTYLTNDFDRLLGKLLLGWDLVLADALNVFYWRRIGGAHASVRQLTAMATELHKRAWAAEDTPYQGERPLAAIAVCHGTKDGNMSGPQAMKHIIDAAFMLDHTDEYGRANNDPNRATGFVRLGCMGKNRFGMAAKTRYCRLTPEPEGIVEAYDPPPAPEDDAA